MRETGKKISAREREREREREKIKEKDFKHWYLSFN